MEINELPEAIQKAYSKARSEPSDIWQHVETLRGLAMTCDSVIELVDRPGESTAAFLVSGADVMSVSSNHTEETRALLDISISGDCFALDSLDPLLELDGSDLLFIDTIKTKDRMENELARYAGKTKKYIVLHDTVTWGHVGETGGDGIWPAIAGFLRSNPEWSIVMHHLHNNGLTVLGRRP